MPTDAQIKAVLESVTKTKDQEIAELLEVNQQLDRDCTKLAIRNAQLVIETEQLKEQFDLVLNERNEAMDESASAKSVHEALVRNITSMSEFAGKAMRERDELARQLEDARATVALLNRKLAQLGMAWADDEDRHAVAALSEDADRFRAERDEARRLLKAVVDMMRDNMAHDATHPHHLCDFIHRPDIGMCKVCEDWTDAMVMCYPDDFQDEEDGK